MLCKRRQPTPFDIAPFNLDIARFNRDNGQFHRDISGLNADRQKVAAGIDALTAERKTSNFGMNTINGDMPSF